MPSATTPQRRRRASESDGDGEPDSSALASSSSQGSTSNKKARLNFSRDASQSTLRTGLLSNENSTHSSNTLLQAETLHSKPSPRKHQPGSIVRVKLTNFVTYTAVEFHPGPSLNMVIGPNGTGKSTLVCAICLGLGWGPQHLGRAKDVSEYVKHGFQEATIEIELAGDGKRFKGKNVIIECNIKRENNKSTFHLNRKPSNKKAVLEVAKSFSIQIDNLCQFLPQDKVVEFAAMTSVELLKSTQRAVATQEMIEMHNNLKELRYNQKEVQANQVSDQDTLANLEGRQRMQEADVERMREREQVKERVRLLEIARPFAKYRGARSKHKTAKERFKEVTLELKQLSDEVEPSLRAVNDKQQYRQQVDAVVHERRQMVDKADHAAQLLDKKVGKLAERGDELVKERDAEINSSKQDKQAVTRAEQTISGLKKQMEEQPPDLDVASCNEQIREKTRAFEDYRREVSQLQRGQEENTRQGRDRHGRIQTAKRELADLESQAGQQDKKLKNMSSDTWKAWDWVKAHQQEFERPVFGPPIVECSVTDPQYVDMIETILQRNSFLSFTVQTKADFKKLQSQAHDILHLSEINIREMAVGIDKFPPPVSKNELTRFGFQGWALDFIQGPEPVLAMLCADSRIHRTAVGLRDTSTQHFEQLQNSPIDSWVTSKSIYNITRRREYGPGATSTRVRDIRRASVWTDQPVDLTVKRELQERIDGWGEEMASFQAKNVDSQTEITRLREEIKSKQEEINEMQRDKAVKQKALGEFRALPTKLAQQEEKMTQAQESLTMMRERLGVIQDKHDAVTMERGKAALDYANAVETLRDMHSSLHEAEIMLIEASSDIAILVQRNSSVKELLQNKQREVDEINREKLAAAADAQRLLQDCRNLMTTADETMAAFFSTLPEGQSSEELEIEIESERARLELMHEGNGGVIREFEQRQKQIDSLTAKLDEINHSLGEFDEKIKELRDKWEPELDQLVGKISDSFSFNMQQISCAGEVAVFKDEDDFDQWAIQIRVKFRESEPLTTLDSHRQSGGERAVSTIFYLMSLQSLTRSPFRVVDEINQGMDPRNERLVHKRMVDIACGSDAYTGLSISDVEDSEGRGQSQYFLITPKLLHGLEYARGMQVLCIASGEYMPPQQTQIDFRGCVDLARGLKAEGVRFGVAVGAA
ncbi:Structural maintenance of chromosomes protein 5 [Lobaria immixta]|nr:Structural maintenance of chromosomes protein 5 [Lobaria immixta]